MFTKTKQISLEGSAIITRTMEGEELERQDFETEEEARAAFSEGFLAMNPDPDTRMEMQEQDVWTIYEKT